jgi:hypothetical protein
VCSDERERWADGEYPDGNCNGLLSLLASRREGRRQPKSVYQQVREREREREQLRARGSREDIWRAQREDEDDEQKLQRGKIASVEIRKTKARLEPLCDYHSKKRMRSNDNNERKREGRWVGLKGERSEEEEEEEQKKVWMGGRA